ncbi:MAG TPA: hypothetical protein VK071_05190 [Tissierellales bacterium]|nr:hypothetical protein [Tissierellales bacterium]
MNIDYVKHVNNDENNRVEYLLTNFDYYDGNDIISKLFRSEFGMQAKEKIDGIFYNIIKLYSDDIEYSLVWHEDVGNYIYSNKQGEKELKELEERLSLVINKLNNLMKDNIESQ